MILTFAAPQIAVFALQFGPLETCALILMGLTCISSVSANNQFKGLAMGVLGLLLACVGMSPFSAESRFTFDIFALNSGIDLVAVIVGVFALSEVLDRVERMRREARVENGTSCRVQLPSLGEWRGRMSGLVKSSLIGTFVGILPGNGAATAAFLSYGEARPFLAPAREYRQGEARRSPPRNRPTTPSRAGRLSPRWLSASPAIPLPPSCWRP